MEKRVKIFDDESLFNMQISINEFLKETSGKLHDIKFVYNVSNYTEWCSALLIYTPEEE